MVCLCNKLAIFKGKNLCQTNLVSEVRAGEEKKEKRVGEGERERETNGKNRVTIQDHSSTINHTPLVQLAVAILQTIPIDKSSGMNISVMINEHTLHTHCRRIKTVDNNRNCTYPPPNTSTSSLSVMCKLNYK